MLKIIPLGGLGEIGLNMMVFEYGDTLMVVDAGLMFPEDYMLGIDYVIPDMDYLKSNQNRFRAVILTHAHEDHIGALPYLLRQFRIPVYGTAFTLEMVRHKLEEHALLSDVRLKTIACGDTLRIPPFTIETFRVNHSVVDGIGLAIDTPEGLIIHTGDFKISYSTGSLKTTTAAQMVTDVGALARYGDRGVHLLLSDSTNVEKKGHTLSDSDIGKTLSRLVSEKTGRIIVALFASSITRIQQIVDLAVAQGRKVVFNGRSIEVSVQIAKSLGYLYIPDDVEIFINQVGDYSDRELMIITTGSQGEPMSALVRMASGMHKQIQIKPGDTVALSSKFIPGNEKAIAKIINNLYRRGADVLYEKISDIHVSGHAFQEELKVMLHLTRPRYFIPIHGEYRHLVLHARLAHQMGIAEENILIVEDGQVVGVDRTGVRITDQINSGRVLIDGKGIGDVGRSVLKERRALSEEGVVAVTMAMDEETGIIVYGPEIFSRGFVFGTETGHLLEDAVCVILEIVEEVGPNMANRLETVRSRIQSALRTYFTFTIKRKPLILVFVMEV